MDSSQESPRPATLATITVVWHYGFSHHLGLTYEDFAIQKRTIKHSGHWYGRVTAASRLEA
jgi:beta-glucosidase/6-phospho-beta-glucosidase/beta-galactosidase